MPRRIRGTPLEERRRNEFTPPRRFERADFLASLIRFKSNVIDGTIEVVFSVGPGEKDAALALTDAPGEMLLVTVERVAMGGSNGQYGGPIDESEALGDDRSADSFRAGRSVD